MIQVHKSKKPPKQREVPLLTVMTSTLARHAANNSKLIIILIFGAGVVSVCVNYGLFQFEELESIQIQKVDIVHEIITDNATNGTHHGGEHNANNEKDFKKRLLPRILCWVMTYPSNHQKFAIHAKKTWGKRCDKTIFMSSENDIKLPAVALPGVGDGRSNLWPKTREAFFYVWKKHRNDADWFIKADDDTYLIVENLRHFLSKYDSTKPIYFGCQLSQFGKGYMSGGAGYALSKEALRLFAEEGESNKCFGNPTGSEDAEMGKCLKDVGVLPVDSRDKFERHRFLPFPPLFHLDPDYMKPDLWYWKIAVHPQKMGGRECCSDTAVSFHYINPPNMYAMDYFIYGLKPRLRHETPFQSKLYNPYQKPTTFVMSTASLNTGAQTREVTSSFTILV